MNTNSNGIGNKFDGGKLMFSLLTRGLALPLKAVAAVLTYGCLKYSADSWKDVPDAKRRYEDALDRHLNDWKDGEICDRESGLPHLAHIACNTLFLMYLYMKDPTDLHAIGSTDWFEFNDPKEVMNKPDGKPIPVKKDCLVTIDYPHLQEDNRD